MMAKKVTGVGRILPAQHLQVCPHDLVIPGEPENMKG
jgi:hypothetical protein